MRRYIARLLVVLLLLPILNLFVLPSRAIGQESNQAFTLNLPSTQVQLMAVNGTSSYFLSTLSGVPPGYDIQDGVYLGWCVDNSVNMNRSVPHSVTMYSSVSPPVLTGFNWIAINFVLNHKQGTMLDIQDAIWYFTDGSLPGSPNAQAMVNAAEANPTYDPTTGSVLAIILIPQDHSDAQNSIIELPLPSGSPTVDFSWSPQFPNTDDIVLFNASGSEANGGTIVSYLWNFGDGNTTNTNESTITHRYTAFGTYNVTLTLTNSLGHSQSLSQQIIIAEDPQAVFTWSPTSPVDHQDVTFDASGSNANGGSITSYSWDFGDGNSSASSSPIVKHAYTVGGNYNVTLVVTDSEGLTGSASHTITVGTSAKHDISILSLWLSTPHEYVGRTVNITITIKNNGEADETFNMTLYRNATSIGDIAISNLAVGEMRTIVYGWKTPDVPPYKNWTISAQAPLAGDINPSDNTFIDGNFYVKMMGDVNADGVVDIFDVVTAAAAFGSTPEDLNWNSQADIAIKFGIIDVYDLVVITTHFGETAPPG